MSPFRLVSRCDVSFAAGPDTLSCATIAASNRGEARGREALGAKTTAEQGVTVGPTGARRGISGRRSTSAAALLGVAIALTACGEGGAETGDVRQARAPAIDPMRIIRGVVIAPSGVDLVGAKAVACLTPRDTCTQEAEAEVTVQNGEGRYELHVPTAGDYHIMVWKDVDGDGASTSGDILAFANDLNAVPSGQPLTPMAAFVRAEGAQTNNLGGAPLGASTEMAAAAAAVRTLGIAGQWSQSSRGAELVWSPEIKIQPSISTSGFGTNLGGTFGAGSQTNTTISYSYKSIPVRRAMTLRVRPDGTFHWTVTQERARGGCRRVWQEKFGRIAAAGDRITFTVVDGRQRCDDDPVGRLNIETETYTLSRSAGGFRLIADKGVDWAFGPA